MAELSMLSASLPDCVRVLIDGGTFRHMFGTGVDDMLINRRSVEALPISTAGGIAYVDEMADCIFIASRPRRAIQGAIADPPPWREGPYATGPAPGARGQYICTVQSPGTRAICSHIRVAVNLTVRDSGCI